MRRILCIFSLQEDEFAKEVVAGEEKQPDSSVKVIRLEGDVNYDELLDAILEADSVQVW